MKYHKEKGMGKMVTKKLTGLRRCKWHEETFGVMEISISDCDCGSG